MAQFDRITRDAAVIGGKPRVRGMRVTVVGAAHRLFVLFSRSFESESF